MQKVIYLKRYKKICYAGEREREGGGYTIAQYNILIACVTE